MNAFTEMEMDVVAALFDNATYNGKYNTEDDCTHPDAYMLVQGFGEPDLTDTLENKFDLTKYRGVISSLIKKGFLEVDKYEISLMSRKTATAVAVALSLEGWKATASTDFGWKYLAANK